MPRPYTVPIARRATSSTRYTAPIARRAMPSTRYTAPIARRATPSTRLRDRHLIVIRVTHTVTIFTKQQFEIASPDISPVCGVLAERFCSRFVLATEAVDTPTSEGARANLGQNIQPEAAKRTVVQTATSDTGRIPQDHQQVTCEKERTGEISGLALSPFQPSS